MSTRNITTKEACKIYNFLCITILIIDNNDFRIPGKEGKTKTKRNELLHNKLKELNKFYVDNFNHIDKFKNALNLYIGGSYSVSDLEKMMLERDATIDFINQARSYFKLYLLTFKTSAERFGMILFRLRQINAMMRKNLDVEFDEDAIINVDEDGNVNNWLTIYKRIEPLYRDSNLVLKFLKKI